MEELFGLSMDVIMRVLLVLFVGTMAVVLWLAVRNRVMLKMGLRPIPRRPGQTVLIVVGVMLSTVIMAAAFGTGDTLTYSIRNEALQSMGHIDEVVVYARAGASDTFGINPYLRASQYSELETELLTDDRIDGVLAQLAETAPTLNTRTSLSEGRMRIVGIDPSKLGGFGPFKSTSGDDVRLDQLGLGQALINDQAADEIQAMAADELQVFVGDEPIALTVHTIIERGGLAGAESTLVLPLDRAQALFDREGQVNLIVVSNSGDELTGDKLSEEVTESLRVRFTDREIAFKLKELLDQPDVREALAEKESSLLGDAKTRLSAFRTELEKSELTDDLISRFGDLQLTETVLITLHNAELRQIESEAIALFANLGEFRVFDFKHTLLTQADQAGSGIVSIFVTMALFSIGVGILLIFLIFVMLAAARRSEMGMARAVGAKRGHLVQMFLYEGTAYALVSAAVGVVIGLGVSALIVSIVSQLFESLDLDFRLITHFELRSIVVAYCLGMAITFATVAFSANRVSRLNIVMAIRDLPEPLIPSGEPPFSARFVGLPKAVARPVIFLLRSVMSLVRLRWLTFLNNIALVIVWVVIFPIWIGDIVAALLRFVWPYLLRGWLTVIVGAGFIWWGIDIKRDAPFTAGASLVIAGVGLMIRKALQRTTMEPQTVDRVATTVIGLVILAFWITPINILEPLTGQLEGDFEMMFVSGIFMVGAAVWTIMYNADVPVNILSSITSRMGKLRPVMVTAVAYPMSDKFRTGLTLAMFALVIFTMMVMSVLTESFSKSFSDDPETVAGAWDIKGDVGVNTPIADIQLAVAEAPNLNSKDFEAIGGYTRIEMEARQAGADRQQWRDHAVRAADDAFMAASQYRLKLIADGYGPTPQELWQQVIEQPGLGVIEGHVLRARSQAESDFPPFQIEGPPFYDDASMSPFEIEMREPRSGAVITVEIVAVLDTIHESVDEGFPGIVMSKATVDEALPFPVPVTTYQFRLTEGVDAVQIAKDIEAAFVEQGMETAAIVETFRQAIGAIRAFSSLFTGFMGLGIVVGIAALGVVSTRAVVERRQQVGVLRAIGYRRRMVQLSFLLEFSFVALLGTALGVVLGLTLGYQAINDIRAEEADETIRFVVPWIQIAVIISLTYVFSFLATFLPARQASRIYPAEALRYE